jgi:hypothetical protein
MKDTVAPQDQADHELGLEIIRVLGLKRNRSNGRIETTHGNKNPCGIARTMRHLSAGPLEKAAPELLDFARLIDCWLIAPDKSKKTLELIQTKARAAIAKATQA